MFRFVWPVQIALQVNSIRAYFVSVMMIKWSFIIKIYIMQGPKSRIEKDKRYAHRHHAWNQKMGRSW